MKIGKKSRWALIILLALLALYSVVVIFSFYFFSDLGDSKTYWSSEVPLLLGVIGLFTASTSGLIHSVRRLKMPNDSKVGPAIKPILITLALVYGVIMVVLLLWR